MRRRSRTWRSRRADGGFRVGYDGRIESGDGVLAFRADIVAENERSLVFTVEFTPETEFRTSRTGFVVLHPVEGVAGEACTITHSDGTVEETAFPDLISPFQPFYDIAAMRHRVAPGVWLTCRFEGADPWETEDQRNWTDASYKTYYRPLALPFPYTLAAGETAAAGRDAQHRGRARPPWRRVQAVGDGAVEVTPSAAQPARTCRRSGSASPRPSGTHFDHGLDLVRALGPEHLVCEYNPHRRTHAE